MRPESHTHHYPAKADTVVPARRPSWGQPAVEEPIIDAARISLSAFGTGRSRLRTIAMYLWLRIIRPALTLGVWFIAIWHAWPYVLGTGSQPQALHLLGIYAIVIVVILALMLVIAPLRRWQQRRETPPDEEESSLFAMASYVDVTPSRLSKWQRTKKILVHHDKNGQLRNLTNTGTGRLEAPSRFQQRSKDNSN
ncbi:MULTISPECIES: poly-beta-1,6-N-acetyl-D-glucosamine biosynthesis protein PgaD [Polaromonas]|uniref:Poly-beta-1,6-N-acetyl-D-glucosamine biosynthesis protein PgaD n=1 Tax=Polaromonas aquatica TaxID=332657 RepID=A0ABW1U3D6_9BURK